MTATLTSTNRRCGACSLCCKVIAVETLDKPAGQWCRHFARGQGCAIHDARPVQCRAFDCHWLLDATMGDEWFPNRCKMVVRALEAALLVHVDASAHQPWRQEPYLSKLVFLARQLTPQGRMVLVLEQGHSILILPDRIVDLGVLDAQDQVALRQVESANGLHWAASVVKSEGRRWDSGPIALHAKE